ncbi:Major pollen allergen Ole e 10, partial [Linum perenne]
NLGEHIQRTGNTDLHLNSKDIANVVTSYELNHIQSLQQTWCIANPLATNEELMANMNYACNHVDCSPIQPGGNCFGPNSLHHHASFVMNLHYQVSGRHDFDCDFEGSGVVSLTDPSNIKCTYNLVCLPVSNCWVNVVKILVGMQAIVDAPMILATWCVARPSTENRRLQVNIDYACNMVDCSAVKEEGSCFNPKTVMNHASFAMNLYYQITGRKSSSCHGTCIYDTIGS